MRYLYPLLSVVCFVSASAADKPVTYRTQCGAVLAEEHFENPDLPAKWAVVKGTWAVVDRTLEGREKMEDQHPGVCSMKLALPANLVMKARLRFEGAAVTTMVFNGAGHICRVTVTPNGFTVTGEKDKKNETDKSVTLGKVNQEFVRGQWYEFTIEITGEEMLVYTDPQHVAYGKDAKIARAKTSVNLTVGKSSVRYDDVVIYAAEPTQDWPKRKAELGLH